MKSSIGTRMKENYENRARYKLTRRTPVIMRLDGKAFHTLTKDCQKPFDNMLRSNMVDTALYLCENIQGAKMAYIQSDEISILITDFDSIKTDAWFDYNIQKMTSVAAGMASVKFSELFGQTGIFDCRVFNVPKEEVINYFIWRQKDWERNSLQMLARSCYSHKELHGKKTADIHEMLYKKNENWAKLKKQWKNGNTLFKQYGYMVENFKESEERIFPNNNIINKEYLYPYETDISEEINSYINNKRI